MLHSPHHTISARAAKGRREPVQNLVARRGKTIQSGMILPIAKLLLKLVAPSIPEIVSTIAAVKQQGARQPQGKTLDERLAETDRTLTQHLELIDALTGQVNALQTVVRRTLLIGMAALLLSLTGLAVMWYT